MWGIWIETLAELIDGGGCGNLFWRVVSGWQNSICVSGGGECHSDSAVIFLYQLSQFFPPPFLFLLYLFYLLQIHLKSK